MDRIMVVGGGVLGTMHAAQARRLGHEVVHLERERALVLSPGPVALVAGCLGSRVWAWGGWLAWRGSGYPQ